jgi:hypothetical protein
MSMVPGRPRPAGALCDLLLHQTVAIDKRLDQLRNRRARKTRMAREVRTADPLRRRDEHCELALDFVLLEPEGAVEGSEP